MPPWNKNRRILTFFWNILNRRDITRCSFSNSNWQVSRGEKHVLKSAEAIWRRTSSTSHPMELKTVFRLWFYSNFCCKLKPDIWCLSFKFAASFHIRFDITPFIIIKLTGYLFFLTRSKILWKWVPKIFFKILRRSCKNMRIKSPIIY